MIFATCKNPESLEVKFTQHNSQTTITVCDSGSDHTRIQATSRRILTTDAPAHFGFFFDNYHSTNATCAFIDQL